MMEFSASQDIQATPEQIFPFLVEPEKRSIWMQKTFGSRSNLAKTEYPNGFDEVHAVGTKFVDVTSAKSGNLEYRLNGEILEYQKPTRFSFRSEAPYFYVAKTPADVRSTTKVTFTLTPNSSGGTTVTWEMLNESNQSLWILNPVVQYLFAIFMRSGIRKLETLAQA